MVYLAPTKTPETMSEPRLGVLVLGWLLVFASAGPWLAASDTVDRGPGTTVAVSAPDGPAVDNTVTRVSVRASGNATWTVEIRTRLGSEREVEQYRAFQAHFRNNTSHYLGTYRERIRSVVGDAERVTGREMRAVNFSASTDVQEVPRRWGVITYRFRWTSFAAAPNATTLTVGDAFEGGYYLDEDDIFAIEARDGYAIESVSPVPDESQSGVVRWSGPRDFADERPHAVLRIVESDATTSAGLDATTAQGETAAGRDAAGERTGFPANSSSPSRWSPSAWGPEQSGGSDRTRSPPRQATATLRSLPRPTATLLRSGPTTRRSKRSSRSEAVG
jgi:hypothetical protein